MVDIENTISNLELNIRWICDNPAHQFPGYGNVEMAMRDAVELLKEQQKTGHWEWKTSDYYRCSECGHETNVDECMEKPIYNYCPYCGTKMLYRKSGYHPQIPHPIDSNTQWT